MSNLYKLCLHLTNDEAKQLAKESETFKKMCGNRETPKSQKEKVKCDKWSIYKHRR